MNHKDLCEHTKIRLIAAAIGHQQCTATAANLVPIPDGRVVATGTPVEIMRLLGFAAEQPTGDLPPLPEPCKSVLPSGWVRYTADHMHDYARAAIAAYLAGQTDEQLRDTAGYRLGWMEGMQEGAELATGGEKTAADVEAEFADLLPGSYYMDPPDGGSPSVLEQVKRMAEDAAQWRAHLARQEQAEPSAWMHEDGRVVTAATMNGARKDGGAMLSSLRGYTIPLYATPVSQAPVAQADETITVPSWVYHSARELAMSIWRDNYKDTAPQWEPLDDLSGVLSQIDNMVSGMTRTALAQAPAKWSKEAPTEQADYWHWDGDEDHAPMIYHVLWSGTAKKCFVSIGQYDINQAIWCDEFGGWWLKIEQPSIRDVGTCTSTSGGSDAAD